MRFFALPVAVVAFAGTLLLAPTNGGAADGTAALALGAGNANYGGDYAPVTATRVGAVVTVGGVVKVQSWTVLATLPAGYRPAKRMVFSVSNHDREARVDVLPDGRILWVAGGKNHGWISLSGIVFPAAP